MISPTMNYRHIYHAGGFADVHKHVLLSIILQAYQLKNKPFFYIDTHAGIGEYDYSREEVSRSPEYLEGIQRFILSSDPEFQALPYWEIVKAYQTPSGFVGYPGSPAIADQFLDSNAEIILNEMHPEDALTLKSLFKENPRVHIHQRDAYEFLPAILPPDPRRAVVLIDPPFEKKSEFDDLFKLIQKSWQRFPQACYLIWYPIKDNKPSELSRKLRHFLPEAPLISELIIKNSEFESGLLGSGVAIINPPWPTEEKIKLITKKLQELFTCSLKES